MKSMLLGTGLVLLGAGSAYAIDCSKASDPIDVSICGNPDALKADQAMSTAYAGAIKLLSPKQIKALKTDQVNWLDLRKDCETTVDADGNASHATGAQMAQCLVDDANARAAYLSGAPLEGPGVTDPLIPVVLFGIDDIFNHTLRFAMPATPGEKAYDAALDAELKKVHTATSDSDNSDAFDETLTYLSPTLLSANIDAMFGGPSLPHPMPVNFAINIDMATGKPLAIADAIDAARLKQVAALCEGQLKDFIAAGTEGDDIRRDTVDTMAGDLGHWNFGASKVTLRYNDYSLDNPIACTIGYDVLRPLLKSSFPLPQ